VGARIGAISAARAGVGVATAGDVDCAVGADCEALSEVPAGCAEGVVVLTDCFGLGDWSLLNAAGVEALSDGSVVGAVCAAV
jgi:hypothetical protein